MKTQLVHRENKGFGYVYVVETDVNHVKIGCSINPQQRIRTIETQSGKHAINHWVSYELENWYSIESLIHKSLKEKRKIGEYFCVSFDEAVTTILSLLPPKLTNDDYLRLESNWNDDVSKGHDLASKIAKAMVGTIASETSIEYSKINCVGHCSVCIDYTGCNDDYENENMLYQCVLNSNDEDIAAQMEWGLKMSNADIELLTLVRKRNEAFILAGLDYKERKTKLIAFAMKHRTKLIAHENTIARP